MDLKDSIRVIEGFPTEGISFKDVTSLLQDRVALKQTIDELAALVDEPVDIIASPEARGFIFGTALAYQLNAGFVPIRKPGKLPGETVSFEYELEYGTDRIEIHKDAIKPGDKVVLVDDLLATGGTLEACAKCVESLGGEVVKILVIINLKDLNGLEKLKDYDVRYLVEYDH